jgi:hypothetical protein
MVLPFFPPLSWFLGLRVRKRRRTQRGKSPPPDSNPLETGSLEKITAACQAKDPQPRIAASSSKNALSFSSARATKRFPLSRCASAIQIVRPQESTAETQPQLQPALLRLSAMISQVFTR